MKFKDYFSKTFATSDNHYIQSLKTHYYHARKEDVMNACLEVLKKMKAIVRSTNDDYGEIIVDAPSFSGTIIITALTYTEIACDLEIMTYNILPSAKGKKIIEEFYAALDKLVPLKGLGLHASF